jgi:hypothetical protein
MKCLFRLIVILFFVFPTMVLGNEVKKCKIEFDKYVAPKVEGCDIIISKQGNTSNYNCNSDLKTKITDMLLGMLRNLQSNEFPTYGEVSLKISENSVSGIIESLDPKQIDSFTFPTLNKISSTKYSGLLDNGIKITVIADDDIQITFAGGFGKIYVEGTCEN